MTALTAIGLALDAAAIVCLTTPRRRRVGWLLGSASAALGLVVIFEYLVAPVGIDQLLFTVHGSTDPGRPSPQTAAALLLLGSSLATTDLRGRRRAVHHVLLAGTAVILIFACVGYLLGVAALRGVSRSDGMALHTLTGFILLSCGTVALQPRSGFLGLMRGRGSGALVARATALFGCSPVVVGAVLFDLQRGGILGPRACLSAFSVAMIVLLAMVALPLIAKLRNAEAQTQKVADELQALFDNAPAVLSLHDTAGRYLQVNEYGAAIVGKRPAELMGQTPSTPATAEPLHFDDCEITRSGKAVAYERRVLHADGQLRDYHLVRYPVLEHGEVRAVGTFGVDITSQKQTVRDLELAQSQFRSAFEEAPIGMLLEGLDGTVQQVNPALCQLVGLDAEELLGQPVATFIADEDRLVEAAARAALRRGSADSDRLEIHYRRGEGHRIPVDVHLTLVRGADAGPSHYVVQVQDTTERRHRQENLQFLADHDPLTGLLNRRAFLRRLELGHRQTDADGAVVVFDLDSLKAVNDTHGHQRGDELLIRVATLTQAQLRASDAIARLGGDEFAVLLPATSSEDAARLAAELLAALEAEVDADGRPILPIAASMGVTAFALGAGESTEAILQRADLAMYEAKRQGGRRVCIAAGPLTGTARGQLSSAR